MKFYSSRNKEDVLPFKEAVFRGLAPDGGLYCPVDMADLSEVFNRLDGETSFQTVAIETLFALLSDEFSKKEIEQIVFKAFPFEPKITRISDDMEILELFHGPSCAFKDFGAGFLSAVMSDILAQKKERVIILTATSGDTGSAVAQAFHNKENIEVVILYPSGRVSPLQEKQLTTLGGNIKALEVKGSFDDCQRMVKEAFIDRELTEKFGLTSANSINLGRLFPQSLYYIWYYTQAKEKDFTFCVPSGNFGNLTAGLYAKAWGLPVDRYIAATNANDIVPDYLKTGDYKPKASVSTHSNAMDVGSPSNYERLAGFYDGKVENFRDQIEGFSISDKETLNTMKDVFERYKYLLCPHTAVGYLAAKRYQEEVGGGKTVVLATAHPGKFVEIVEKATGEKPLLPKELQSLITKEKRAILTDNTLESLRDFLEKTF